MYRVLISTILLVLVACGGGLDPPLSPPSAVAYKGTALVVRSVLYERSPENFALGKSVCEDFSTLSTCYIAGEILITVRDEAAFRTMSAELDVRLTSGSARGLTVPVPPQFERQWVRVLLNEPSVASAAVELLR